MLEEIDVLCKSVLTPEKIQSIVELIPDEWLTGVYHSPLEHREAYAGYLNTRITHSHVFVKEAQHAR
jgi:hypothetical protein